MELLVNDKDIQIQNLKVSEKEVSFLMNGKIYQFKKDEFNSKVTALGDDRFHASYNQVEGEVTICGKVSGAGKVQLTEGSLTSPMPGKVFKVFKKSGDKVSKGDAILIIEAMKMEHTIRAQKDGVIASIAYKEGEQVDGGVSLAEIE